MLEIGSILIGLFAGIGSGFFGIGGGLIMVPAMVYFFQFTQHQAQGTSLAVLTLPVVILGTIKYHQEGNANLYVAVFIAVSFVAGAYLGATFAHYLSNPLLKKCFGVLLLIVALKIIFWE